MKFSEAFVNKFLKGTFKDITARNWLVTNYYYIIDSKFRKSKRLDIFLSEQLDDPHPKLKEVAKMLRRKSKHPDTLILNILKYVCGRVRYVRDNQLYYKQEYWADAYATWKVKQGDCEDMNSLIYVLARLAGISAISLWSVIGDSAAGGHYWLIYYSSKQSKWYSIDASYYPNFNRLKSRKRFKLSDSRYKGIWYMFTDQIIMKQR